MRIVLILIIKIYWKLIPESKRRKCLFKTSCSNYVYQVTKEKGIIAGIKALKFRINNCNPDYSLINLEGKEFLITRKNILLGEDQINKSIL